MSEISKVIVFFHGLNTYGDDLIHIGPWLKFFPQEQEWKKGLRERGLCFVSAGQLGADTPTSQAKKALDHILEVSPRAQPLDIHAPLEFILLGHSAGGIAARRFAHLVSLSDVETKFSERWPKNWKVSHVLSFGSPHHGLELADIGSQLRLTNSGLYWSLRLIGYDAEKRKSAISQYSSVSMRTFNREFPNLASIAYGHFACAAQPQLLNAPLRALALLKPGLIPKPSDGFVSVASQDWGRSLGEFDLDHFSQLGLHLQVHRAARQKAHQEFLRLLDRVAEVALDRSRD